MEITEQGAQFSGEIQSETIDQIEDHGFVWGLAEELPIESSKKLVLGKPDAKSFSADIRSNLVMGKDYFVRAFVETPDKTVYGNIVSFRSLGSEGPVVTGIEPTIGAFGDTIKIKGRNFQSENGLKVRIGDEFISEYIISVSSEEISFIIPDWISFQTIQKLVAVTIEGNVSHSPVQLTIDLEKSKPKILSVFPTKIKACDTVMLIGKNLTSSRFPPSIYVVGSAATYIYPANVVKASRDTVAFTMSEMPAGDLLFTFNSRFSASTEGINLEELRPEIVSMSSNVYLPGDIITIKMKNLPMCNGVKIIPIAQPKLSDNGLELISYTKDELRVKINDCLGRFRIALSFERQQQSPFAISAELKSQPVEVYSIEPSVADLGQEVVIKGKNLTRSYYLDFLSVTSSTSTEIRGTVIESPMVESDGTLDVVIPGCDSSIVIPNGFKYNPPVITDFNPKVITSPMQSITVTGKNFSSNPGQNSIKIGSFDEFYVMGENSNTIIIPASAFILDPGENVNSSAPIILENGTYLSATSSANLTVNYETAWTSLGSSPITSIDGIGFSIGGKGYVTGGSNGYQDNKKTWEYSPSTDSWTEKEEFPGTTNQYLVGAATTTKAYIGLGMTAMEEWWEYDPTTDSWTRKADFPGALTSSKFVLSLNGKVYVGGGLSEDADPAKQHQFWEYNPALNQWTRKANIPIHAWTNSARVAYNGKGYYYSSDDGVHEYECAYNPPSDQWTTRLIPSYYGAGTEVEFAMIIDDYVIFAGGPDIDGTSNFYHKIKPGTGTMVPVVYAGFKRAQYIGFSIGDYGYSGLGHYPHTFSDMWRFDARKLINQ